MNLSQIEEEFDIKHANTHWTNSKDWIKQFYRTKFTELLEETKLEKVEEYTSYENLGGASHNAGYNEAVSDQEQKIKKALE